MQSQSLALLPTGTLFHDRYVVLRGLGAGAMGAVHEVRDRKTHNRCALKVMLPHVVENDELRLRFAQEARITGDILSDHLVRVLDAGFDPTTCMPFLVMELLHGEELGRLLKQKKRFPPEEVTLYLAQAALALDKTHAAGIVHRDLKPGNLFVTHRDDGSPCVKILDFGIAKVIAGDARNQTTKAIGTPIYMAPEQILGKGLIGPATDIYALGHIAYALLVGEPYWSEESRTLELFPFMQQVVEGAREPATERAARRMAVTLPPGFDEWFRKVTARSPALRFDRASVAVAALRAALVPAKAPAPAVDATIVARPLSLEPAAMLPQEEATTTVPMSARTSKAVAEAVTPPAELSTIIPGNTSFSVTSPRPSSKSRRTLAIGGVALLGIAGVGTWILRASTASPDATSPSASAAAPTEQAASAEAKPEERVVPPTDVPKTTPQATATPSSPPTLTSPPEAPATNPPRAAVVPTPPPPAKAAQPESAKAPSPRATASSAPPPPAPPKPKFEQPDTIE
ncbi:protein kinase [Polyangium jinanense]|uniref:serine/threonine-protein kinase n=1 Tax=Polyangium jinanense TaxID=2829994 RepID=UPI0023418CA0|nr:serine/threonine protein kinase [Polyangium jinanense]MDC3958532.1 protein kinase [Polyangium jinanense]